MNITREQYKDLCEHSYSAYGDGAYPNTIVHIVLSKLEVTIDGMPLNPIGFSYKHGPSDVPVTEWERVSV